MPLVRLRRLAGQKCTFLSRFSGFDEMHRQTDIAEKNYVDFLLYCYNVLNICTL